MLWRKWNYFNWWLQQDRTHDIQFVGLTGGGVRAGLFMCGDKNSETISLTLEVLSNLGVKHSDPKDVKPHIHNVLDIVFISFIY